MMSNCAPLSLHFLERTELPRRAAEQIAEPQIAGDDREGAPQIEREANNG